MGGVWPSRRSGVAGRWDCSGDDQSSLKGVMKELCWRAPEQG